MSYFPFFMNIEGKRGLIVGGGKPALFKIKKLFKKQKRRLFAAFLLYLGIFSRL